MLYKDCRADYAGRATDRAIGVRLRQHHRRDRLAGRWDRFSWYGTRRILSTGRLGKLSEQKRGVAMSTVIATMEALLIATSEGLNRTKERIPGAEHVSQLIERSALPVRTQLERLQDGVEAISAA